MRAGSPAASPPNRLTISLTAQDLAGTRDFYVRDLGLTLMHEDASRLLIGIGGASLEFLQHEGRPAGDDTPLLTLDCDDADSLLKRLRALGVEVDVPPPTTGGASPTRFLARDPDGRVLMFVASTP